MSSLRTFYDRFPITKISKGEVILQQGETPEHGFAIKRGAVKITNVSSDGNEKIISFKITNDLFPICWIFSKTNATLFYYQAHTDCEVYIIDKDIIEHQLESEPEFVRSLLDKQVNNFVSNSLQIDALVQSKASVKLLYMFRHLSLRFGRKMNNGFIRIQVPLTQSELANLTGLTRETTILELHKLKRSDVISSRHKYYTVNIDKLSNRIDDWYDPNAVSFV
jgi:CRP/FNR family transcriptional regulator